MLVKVMPYIYLEIVFYILMGQPRPIFIIYIWSFSKKHHYNFYNKYMLKVTIRYTMPGFEPTTSSDNH